MQKSLILVVDENNLHQVESNESGNFVEMQIWERSHIQEWIRKNPEILGEELLILSIEFDKFKESNDRLDILAMDTQGNLVVIELKRDNLAGYADLQALRYAAMISSMTLDILLPYFVKYYNKYQPEQPIDNAKAEELIREFANDDFVDFTTRPRIILCSENFSQELTTTILWLRQSNVDVACVRIKPHKIGDKIIVIPTVIIPLPEAKQYQTEIQKKEESIQNKNSSVNKRPATLGILIENHKLHEGEIISLNPDALPTNLRPLFNKMTADFYRAKISGKYGQTNKVIWLHDNKEYSISGLTKEIFRELHPEKLLPNALAGGLYWNAENGKSLNQWADEIWSEING